MKKRTVLFLLLCIFLNNTYSQIQVRGNVDNSDFPSINFVLHNRAPDLSKSNDFQFFENIDGVNTQIDSVFFELIEDKVDYSKQKKCVLIMLEMSHHKDRFEQVVTFKNALQNSIDAIVNDGDKVMIVAFALRDQSTNIIENITSSFSDDKAQIKQELQAYEIDRNDFTNKAVSDIMGALDEGIDLLVAQENQLPKSILLLSEEKKNKHATLTAKDVIERAKTKDIVINTVKYNRKHYYQFVEPTLAKETYGISEVLTSPSINSTYNINRPKQEEIERVLIDMLDNCVERASGNEYLISLTLSNDIKDGRDQEIIIKQVDSKYQHKFNFKVPGNWVVAQFQKHLILAIIISVVLFLILLILFLYLRKKIRLKRIDKEHQKSLQKKINVENEAEILKQKEKINAMQEQESRRIQAEELEERKKIKSEEKKILLKQMKDFGPFPILRYSDGQNTDQFEINQPVISVGRDKSKNDICIPNTSFSRQHFLIVFKENQYAIIDNNSMNGMLVNGYKVKEAVLNHGDIIEITDVTFTFYL